MLRGHVWKRWDPAIIHIVGGRKPWSMEARISARTSCNRSADCRDNPYFEQERVWLRVCPQHHQNHVRGTRRRLSVAPPTGNDQHTHHPHHPPSPPASPASHHHAHHPHHPPPPSATPEAGDILGVDQNHDGQLSIDELTAMVKHFDKNHDGSLSLGELTSSDYSGDDADEIALAGDGDDAPEWSTQLGLDGLTMGAILLLFAAAFLYFYALEQSQAHSGGAHARVPSGPAADRENR